MKIKSLLKTATLLSAAISIGATTSCVTPAPTVAGIATSDSATGEITYPVAKPVLDEAGQPRKDLFISPYAPYNPIDTKGFKSGEIAGDPSTAAVSKKTGKPVLSTSKAFRLP